MAQSQYQATSDHFRRLRQNIKAPAEVNDMGKSYRKQVVLHFLDQHRLAMPPSVLYRNLRLLENATFSQNSMENYLIELEEDGLVKRIDPKDLEDREISDVGEDRRAYYLITEAGVEAAPDEIKLA